jgi:hypothetical protein
MGSNSLEEVEEASSRLPKTNKNSSCFQSKRMVFCSLFMVSKNTGMIGKNRPK